MRRLAVTFLLAFGSLSAASPADTPTAQPLPAGSFSVSWQEAGVSRSWDPGERRQVSITVRNLGPNAWPDRATATPQADGRYAVRLSHCWREQGGAPTEDCWSSRTELSAPVAPGASGTFVLELTAPPRIGRFEVEFDLVQEMVSWFRAQGGRTLVVPTLVRPPSAAKPASRAAVAVRVVTALSMAVVLLFVVGFGVTACLVPRRLAPAVTLLAPVVGLAVLSAAGHALAYAPVGTDVTLLPIVLACLALDVVAWRRGARPRFPRAHLPAWLIFVGALALTSYPLVVLADLTAMGGEIDTVIYVVRADWMRAHGMLVRPGSPVSEDFIAALVWEPIRNGLRQGDQLVLAALSSLARVRAFRMFSILQSVFHALAPLGAFALARYGLRLPRATASLAAALVAVQPIAHYVALNCFMSQNSGLALFPYIVLCVLVALRPGPWRRFALAGLLVGALSTFYTVYVVYLVPVMALAALIEWLTSFRGRPVRAAAVVAGRLLAVAVAAVALFPVGWSHGLLGLKTIRTISSGEVGDVSVHGNVALYPHPGAVFGLVGHANAAHAMHLPEPPAMVTTALLLTVMLVFAVGVSAAPRRTRLLLAGVLLVGAVGAAHQRFGLAGGRGFPYGYFKVVSLFAPFLLIGVAHGCVWLWRRAGRGGPIPAAGWRLAGGGVAVAMLLLASFNVWQQAPVLAYKYLAVDRATSELDGVGVVVPRSEGMVVADKRWPGRAWTLYMLEHGRVFDRLQPGLPDFPAEARSPRVLRYAFVAKGEEFTWTPGEPWGLPGQHEVVWSGRRFTVLRRTDGALADLRLSHPGTRVGLAQPLRIETGRSLSVSGAGVPSGRLEQELEWCPGSLALSLTAPRGGVLRIVDGERTRQETLTVGTQTIRLPASPALELALQPPDEDARVWGVKALAPPGS